MRREFYLTGQSLAYEVALRVVRTERAFIGLLIRHEAPSATRPPANAYRRYI